MLRVMLRPPEEEAVVASPGVRVTEIGRGHFEMAAITGTNESAQTPIIISPAHDRAARTPLTIYRAGQSSEVPRQ